MAWEQLEELIIDGVWWTNKPEAGAGREASKQQFNNGG